jgi:hypothetical protein
MGWELRRGLLNPVGGEAPGSPWWRAINDRLLCDTAEARAHVLGLGGPMSSSSVADSVTFVRQPSVRTWYRAHNAIIVRAYLDNRVNRPGEFGDIRSGFPGDLVRRLVMVFLGHTRCPFSADSVELA